MRDSFGDVAACGRGDECQNMLCLVMCTITTTEQNALFTQQTSVYHFSQNEA